MSTESRGYGRTAIILHWLIAFLIYRADCRRKIHARARSGPGEISALPNA